MSISEETIVDFDGATPQKQTGPVNSPNITANIKRNNLSKDSIRIIYTPTPTAISTFFFIQRVGYYEASNGFIRTSPHLEGYNIFLTTSGSGYFDFDGQHHVLRSGDIVWLDCKKDYTIGVEDESWNYYWIQFNGNSARGYYKEFTKYGNNYTHVNNLERFKHLFEVMLNLAKSSSIRREILANDSIVHIMTLLLENRVDSSLTLNSVPEYIRQSINYLNWNYTNKVNLDDLSEQVGVSKFHLSRNFKRYVGVNISEYLNANRMRYARDLLKYTDYSIKSIAQLCGIPQPSHFSALFKELEGYTPLQYRKKWEATGYFEENEPNP
ncbi:MAG: AraC family transcriptional regulator [Atopobium sp.]|uniref:AraC family transcriptional regulator n=1 Tax=Atopobium sp. TaxID=1872650 RepID=UPI002A7F699B|nr:AraC family transcriptional regulator [Atopobium sp.]MDY4522087.1 AraC family transcriptional regulator [Atopobium sp.]